VTTTDTAAIRTWARKHGMTVADRGRLPAEVRAAYAAAQTGSASRPAPAKTGAKAGSASPAEKAHAPDFPPAPDEQVDHRPAPGLKPLSRPVPATPVARTESAAPQPGTRPAQSGSDRVAVLETQLAALTERVARLEHSPPPTAKPSLFRRRNS
jgi:hypothetical protein